MTIRRFRGIQPTARAPIAPEFAHGLKMAIGGRTDPEFYKAPSSSASVHRVGRGTTSPTTAGDPWPGGIGYKVNSSISNVIRAATTTNDPDTLIEINASSWTFQVCVYNPSGSGTNPGFFRSGDTETGSTFVIDNGSTRRPWIRVNGTDVIKAASGPQWPSSGFVNFIFRFVQSTSVDVWWGGIQQHTATHSVAQIGLGLTLGVYVIGRQNGAEYLNGTYSAVRWWDRALTDDQVRRLARDPNTFYAPLPRMPVIGFSAAASFNAAWAGAANQVISSGARAA